MEITTTLNEIKKHSPCSSGWEKALSFLSKTGADDEPLSLLTILESNGFRDALWALRAVDAKYDNALRLYACFCARYVLDLFEKEYPDDKGPRRAIETAERYARGLTTKEDVLAAQLAVVAAANVAKNDADKAACYATNMAAADAEYSSSIAVAYATRDAATGRAAYNAARAAGWTVFNWGANIIAHWAAYTAIEATSFSSTDALGDSKAPFISEFKRLCHLEGGYGEVVTN